MDETLWSKESKKAARRRRLIRWLPPLVSGFIRLLSLTLRFRIHVPEGARRLAETDAPFVLAFWHGRMLVMPPVYRYLFGPERDIWTLISRHWDGELIARTVAPFGIRSVRGSSTRGGREAYGELVEKVRQGDRAAITPDGPRGPRGHVHAGVIRLAAETGAPILPVTWSARPRLRAGSWDRFQIPLPFARVHAAFGEPIHVSDIDGPGRLEAERRSLAKYMDHLTARMDTRAKEARKAGWMFWTYNVLLVPATLLLLPYFLWKIATVEKYRAGFFRRFGFSPPSLPGPERAGRPLWIHGVSMGEILATLPLYRRLRVACPELPVVASSITRTGMAVARERFEGVRRIVYFPFDFPWPVWRTLRGIRPRLVVHTETEIWPNFLLMLARRGIPSAIVNGRISEDSCRNHRKVRFFTRQVLSNVAVFSMQSRRDCLRIIGIGADPSRVHLVGNMKHDVPVPDAGDDTGKRLRGEMGFSEEDLILVAGSTHEGEEETVLEVFRRLRGEMDRLKLLVAPRHPERFGRVERLLNGDGLSVQRRSAQGASGTRLESDVLLLDTIGELALAYSVADVAFVGGSLVPVGGHNLLEPVRYRKPVLFGPYTHKIQDVAAALVDAGGGNVVEGVADLFEAARRLLGDAGRRKQAGEAAHGVLAANRGATERNLALLGPLLASGGTSGLGWRARLAKTS